jgi:hypothetical protein
VACWRREDWIIPSERSERLAGAIGGMGVTRPCRFAPDRVVTEIDQIAPAHAGAMRCGGPAETLPHRRGLEGSGARGTRHCGMVPRVRPRVVWRTQKGGGCYG